MVPGVPVETTEGRWQESARHRHAFRQQSVIYPRGSLRRSFGKMALEETIYEGSWDMALKRALESEDLHNRAACGNIPRDVQ